MHHDEGEKDKGKALAPISNGKLPVTGHKTGNHCPCRNLRDHCLLNTRRSLLVEYAPIIVHLTSSSSALSMGNSSMAKGGTRSKKVKYIRGGAATSLSSAKISKAKKVEALARSEAYHGKLSTI